MAIKLVNIGGRLRLKLGAYIYVLSFILANSLSNSLFLGKRPYYRVEMDPEQSKVVSTRLANPLEWMNLKNYIKYRLWTRKNPTLAQQLKINDMRLMGTSNFNASHRTKIIVHGYAHSANELYLEQWLADIRDAYLKKMDLNIIIVDYTYLALPQFYYLPGPKLVTEQLAEFIKFLVKQKLVQLEHLHLVGYSWGAHIAGNTGHKLKGQIGRITGLDPANPLHRYVPNELRLDKSDAKFVDIIHTNSGGPFSLGFLGLEFPLAHADFYPNSGKSQPGCPKRWIMIYETIECDHLRSVTLFTESILFPEAFPSCPCSSWEAYVKGSCFCNSKNSTLMGEAVSFNSSGKFYLSTRGKSPYGFGGALPQPPSNGSDIR